MQIASWQKIPAAALMRGRLNNIFWIGKEIPPILGGKSQSTYSRFKTFTTSSNEAFSKWRETLASWLYTSADNCNVDTNKRNTKNFIIKHVFHNLSRQERSCIHFFFIHLSIFNETIPVFRSSKDGIRPISCLFYFSLVSLFLSPYIMMTLQKEKGGISNSIFFRKNHY